MKFSLQLISNFINLDQIQFNEFEKNLTLSGLEIDSIERIEKYKDKIIDINITTNRDEICSSFSLAREASAIFNIPIKILPIPTNYKNSIEYNCNKLRNTKYTHRAYTRIVNLEAIFTKKTPDWLLYQLRISNIKASGTLNNIQEYIRIKWGQTFYITNNQEINEQKNIIKYSHLIQLFHQKEMKTIIKSTNNQFKLLIFTTISKQKNNTTLNNESSEFYENMFIDSIKLINTLIRTKIGKYSEMHQNIIIKNKNIQIRKKDINKSLGYIKGQKLQFIKTHKIKNILQQLNLSPKHCKTNKLFEVTIPNYRAQDLTREIDIIEEIGRIYQFQHFFSKIKKNNLQGYKSSNFTQVKQIRNTLNKLGLHEVINFCITKNIKQNIHNPQIHNPITYEQQELRINILENLINNYNHNIKNLKNNIEIFEIGKVFEIHHKSTTLYIEKRNLGGLIHNKNYTRNNWSNQSSNINLFHFKNMIETFLETINSKAIIKEIHTNNEKTDEGFAEHLFKTNKKLEIHDPKKHKRIGIIGELNNKFIKKSHDKHERIYIFEINLNQLIETTKSKNHLEYTSKKYSNYPSVTRDISIKLEKYVHIEKVKQNIISKNNELIESLEILNEYKNSIKNNTTRYISLRVTYRSKAKTLNNEDIKSIDTNLENILKELQHTSKSYIKGKT
uniref:Phenylalanine-tRNA ligase beta subunit n=1 Tax=Tayloriella tenebrosa TaxID=1917049 RepID=UPI0022FD749A|nr:Phenylalanine-tRNA ligase beta subunit [Tayloriella tenebrosa]WAX03766.1 Phenylalanine-tRNA ligase beta subunit [Tayloriella tenebrosa]